MEVETIQAMYVFMTSAVPKSKLGSDIDGAKGGDRFGSSISLSSNGKRLAVGAQFGDGAAKDPASSTYMSIRMAMTPGHKLVQAWKEKRRRPCDTLSR